MRYVFLLILFITCIACNKPVKDHTCGMNPEFYKKFDGGFVALANVITPDGDSLDEAFGPVSYGLQSMSLVIKDAKDNTVYESTEFDKWWDGRMKGEVTEGNYTYFFKATTTHGEEIVNAGQVCVITGKTDICFDKFDNFRFISLYSQGSWGNPEVYREKYNHCD
jgi:hypothetical protein